MSNTFPPADISGVGTLVAELHQQLLAAGHHSLVLVRRAPPGAGVVAIGGPKLLFPWIAVWRYLGLARVAGRDPFDVVHVHESDGVLVAAAVRGLRAFGRAGGGPRLLATLQVSYVRERRAVRAVRAGVPSGRVVSRPVASEWLFKWLRAPLLAALGRLTVRLADGVVAPSSATAGELRADYGARAVAVIPNGIAAGGNAEPPARQAPDDAGTVLFVGRLRTRKAAAVLVEAWSESGARVSRGASGAGRRRRAARPAGGPGRTPAAGSLRAARGRGAARRDRGVAASGRRLLPALDLYEGFPLAILEAMNHRPAGGGDRGGRNARGGGRRRAPASWCRRRTPPRSPPRSRGCCATRRSGAAWGARGRPR